MRFAISPERCKILKGFLGYRSALHSMGFEQGFQWLDGSFAENVELLELRAPKDIDLVSFVHTPANYSLSAAQLNVLDHDYAKATYLVDSYLVEINLLPLDKLVSQSTYWYSMWSHRRNQDWKGYLQVDLSSGEDVAASAWLDAQMVERTTP